MRFSIVFLCVLSQGLADEEALQDFISGNNLFTASVYKEVLKNKAPNFLVSPFSAETVLALTQSGCKGKTAEEIQNALRLPNDKERIESAIKVALPNFKGNDSYALYTANKMYVQKDFVIRDEFQKIATDVYQAVSENIDFTKSDEAANAMNKWVEQQTENKIRNLIDPSNLDSITVLVLINALYFKGGWLTQFVPYATEKKNFYKTATDVVQVDTMHHYSQTFNYFECSELGAKFLELPFEGGDVSMTIILPNEKEGLSSLENQLDKVFTPHKLTTELVNVALPKFKIESKIDFKKVLENLGVKAVFDLENADMSGIAVESEGLAVSVVMQKTFIDVDEKGVEAAAATFVAINRGVSGYDFVDAPKPKDFIVDHPFIFYIKAKSFIIFAGKVTTPGQ